MTKHRKDQIPSQKNSYKNETIYFIQNKVRWLTITSSLKEYLNGYKYDDQKRVVEERDKKETIYN